MIKPTLEEISQLASSGMSHRGFCNQFLEKVAVMVGADAGAVWEATSMPFQVVSQYSRGEPLKMNLTREAHDQLLQESTTKNQPIMVRAAKNGVANMSGPVLVIGTFDRWGKFVVEVIFNDASKAPDEKHIVQTFGAALNKVNQASTAGDASGSIGVQAPQGQMPQIPGSPDASNTRQANKAASFPRLASRDDVSNYLTGIHASIDRKTACANVANETRRVLDCDRVSVLLKHRGKFRLFAISGQISVNRRSNTAKMLEDLAAKTLKTGQAFWYPDEVEIPPQISSTLDDYLALTATRSLIVEPIYEKIEDQVVDPESNERKMNRVIGGVVYEHCNEQWSRSEVESTIGFASLHSGNAIRNATKHQNLFLYPVWNLLGKSQVLTAPRLLPKTLLALGAVLLTAGILYFYPADFSVTAEGVLVPKNLSRVYAQMDGEVQQLYVEHGKAVSANQTLATLTSQDHELRIKRVEGDLSNARSRLEMIQDRSFDRTNNEDNTQDSIESIKAQIKNLESQRNILLEMSQGLTAQSPIAGEVITWDIERQLNDRPVQRGQILMEIAEVDGEWELELNLEDKRIGHINRALARADGKPLEVTFLLAANTSKRYTGELLEISQATELTSDNQQTIKLKVKIDSSEISIDQARTGITAKIVCGKTSLGYYLLHDIQEFWQKTVGFFFA